MSRAARLAAFIALFWAQAAAAQEVAIRSGWQPAFTRLVLSIPPQTGWRLGRIGAGYGLRLDAPAPSFDTDGVFDRIPGERLAGLRQDGATLEVALACDCHMTAFLWRPQRLVLDIRDGAPPPGSEFESPLVAAAPRPTALPLLPGGGPRRVLPLAGPGFDIPAGEAMSGPEEALTRSVLRAAGQGLLETSAVGAGGGRPSTREEPAAAPAAPAGRREPAATPAGLPRITARTSLDRDLSGILDGHAATDAEPDCGPAAGFASLERGRSDDPAAAIAAARRTAAAPDALPRAHLDLARAYLLAGFGAEARQALRLSGALTAEGAEAPASAGPETARQLDAAATLIDGGVTDYPFGAQWRCASARGLWALLADPGRARPEEVPRNAVLQGFRALSPPLREALRPRLSEIFLDLGDRDAAALILGEPRGPDARDTDPAATVRAQLLHEEIGPDAAFERLAADLSASGRAPPEVLLALLALAERTGRRLDAGLATRVDGARYDWRGTPTGRRLTGARVTAALSAGQVDEALSILVDEGADLEADRRRALLSRAVTDLAREGDEARFLRAALGTLPRPIDAAAENAVAARLLDLGFPEAAKATLRSRAVAEAARERRYLRARAAIMLGDPDRARALLAALEDPRADRLRARAHEAEGDFASALAALQRAGTADPSLRWRAADWTGLVEAGDPLLQRAAEARRSGPAPSPLDEGALASPGAGPLARSRALLARSAETRTLVGGLRDRFGAAGESGAD